MQGRDDGFNRSVRAWFYAKGKGWEGTRLGCLERVGANGGVVMNELMCTWLFCVGVAILQRSIRLYAPFYSSDILIASPLGLRTIIGAEGEKKRDFDFLSSVELLIIDQADIYLMQNWEHVLVMPVIHIRGQGALVCPWGYFCLDLNAGVVWKQGHSPHFLITHRVVNKLSKETEILVNIFKSPEKISPERSFLLTDL